MRARILLLMALACGLSASVLCASNPTQMAETMSNPAEMTESFPEVPGIPKAGKYSTYGPEDLYKYIDGAADVYLGYGFQELATQIYENDEGQSLTIEVYRHIDSRNGFGIYALERPEEGDFLEIGAQGYYEECILNFVLGSYYVKLSGFGLGEDERSVLTEVAEAVAERLAGEPHLPKIIGLFPERGRVRNSERFLPLDFLGYSFLRNAFTCDYGVSETTFRIFVIAESDSARCDKALREYARALKSPEKDVKEGLLTFEDPHHGTVGLVWEGRFIWGVLGLERHDLRTEYLTLIKKGLRKAQ